MNATTTDLAQANFRVNELSGGVISISANEFPVQGVDHWIELSFNAEHDLCLVFMVLTDGSKVACVAYGPSSREVTEGWGRWQAWDDLLTENKLWSFASENENYDDSKASEILAVLRPLILG